MFLVFNFREMHLNKYVPSFSKFIQMCQHMYFRWNERTLREMNEEQDDAQFRHNSGRLDKWKQVARSARPVDMKHVEIPEKIECCGRLKHILNNFAFWFNFLLYG